MKWGILATGNIAQKFASTLKQMEGEGEILTAAGSRRAESAAAFGAAYGIPHTHGSYEALAADPEVEAVYIAMCGCAWNTASTCCAKSLSP